MSTENAVSPMDHPQDAVLEDYKKTRAFQNNPKAQESLHMFFSSWRIPVGLTDNEVAICIRLYPYRTRMIERYNEMEDAKLARYFKDNNIDPSFPRPTLNDALSLVEMGAHDTVSDASEHLDHGWRMMNHLRLHPLRFVNLPEELSPHLVMTRERFRAGIRKFIAQYRKICEPNAATS